MSNVFRSRVQILIYLLKTEDKKRELSKFSLSNFEATVRRFRHFRRKRRPDLEAVRQSGCEAPPATAGCESKRDQRRWPRLTCVSTKVAKRFCRHLSYQKFNFGKYFLLVRTGYGHNLF
jgi:hypothetical protein